MSVWTDRLKSSNPGGGRGRVREGQGGTPQQGRVERSRRGGRQRGPPGPEAPKGWLWQCWKTPEATDATPEACLPSPAAPCEQKTGLRREALEAQAVTRASPGCPPPGTAPPRQSHPLAPPPRHPAAAPCEPGKRPRGVGGTQPDPPPATLTLGLGDGGPRGDGAHRAAPREGGKGPGQGGRVGHPGGRVDGLDGLVWTEGQEAAEPRLPPARARPSEQQAQRKPSPPPSEPQP